MIIVKLYGGVGNQMFQYALGRNLALKNKDELKLDITHYKNLVLPKNLPYRSFDLSIFKFKPNLAKENELALFRHDEVSLATRVVRKIRNTITPYRVIYEPHFHFYPEILKLKGNIYLDGYWQSEKYFIENESVIRNDFEISTTLEDEGKQILMDIKNTNSICFNVRRQEFATNPHINEFIGEEYMYRAIELMASKVANPHFFIFSDELSWVKEHIQVKYPHTFVEEHLYGDRFRDCLFLMKECKHIIIPNSTFAWWAAWLNTNPGKIVIAPENWTANSSKDTKDVIPDKWIRI